MSAKKAKAQKEEPIVTEKPVQQQPVVSSGPEYLGDGMSRPEPKVNPMDEFDSDPTPLKQGKWVKVSREELESLEAKGLLVGYDPSTNEAKIKES